MNNILVTGSNGQLGSEVREISGQYPAYNFFFTNTAVLDITDSKKVEQFVIKNNIEIIINCAAYTAVDKAETEFERSNQINHLAVANLAQIAKDTAIQLIHISTDYVFDGNNYKPYVETDSQNPQNVYGKTKLAGEAAMLKINPTNGIIIRTSWVYSSFGNNFVKTMLRLGQQKESLNVISDQIGTPTYARDLAKAILDIVPQIDHTDVSVFLYSNEGVCSWYDFANAIFEMTNMKVNVHAIDSSQYQTLAKRPYYSVMNTRKIKEAYQIEIAPWRTSLKACLKKLNP